MEADQSSAAGSVHVGAKDKVLPASRRETGRKPLVA